MPDTAPRTDAINVQEIMEQIRTRILEKRGSDAPDGPPQAPGAGARAFADAKGGAELLAALRGARTVSSPVAIPSYAFEDYTLFESTRGPLRFIRRLLLPLLKLFFNPNPLIHALNTQTRVNALLVEREAGRERAHAAFEQAEYDALHALIVETARLHSEMKRLSMQMESLTSRLDFNEKRARAIEGAIVYRPTPDERVEPVREARREEPPPSRENRESREPRENRENRDNRESREHRDHRDSRENRDNRDSREPQAVQATTAPEAQPPSTPGANAPGGEGAGSRGRRRRRRRGRRGGGQVPGAPGSPAAAVSDATPVGQSALIDTADAGSGDDEGDWESGESTDTPDEPGASPDRVDSDPSDQGQ